MFTIGYFFVSLQHKVLIVKMRNTLCIIILLIQSFIFALTSCTSAPADVPAYIAQLDSLIECRDNFVHDKLIKIEELRQYRHGAISDDDVYVANNLLFDEYITFNSDSAMRCINENIIIALRTGDERHLVKSRIKKSELLTALGFLQEATAQMQRINRDGLDNEQLVDYYSQMIFLYSHLGDYDRGYENQAYLRQHAYSDSIMAIIPKTHPDYLWHKALCLMGHNADYSDFIPTLKNAIDGSALNSRQDAKNAYALGLIYNKIGDKENYRKYMALSAIADVRIANAEISSMGSLADIFFDNGHGDIDRANTYINYQLDKNISYPDRVKVFGTLKSVNQINDVYRRHAANQRSQNHIFIFVLCIIAVVLICTIITIVLQNRHLKKQQRKLDQNVSELSAAQQLLNNANSQLLTLNKDLKNVNEALKDANYIKEEYLGYLFSMCSGYIGKLGDLRKSIHTKAIAKKYKEIETQTGDENAIREELRDFYHSFDSIFLHIYPDFISDFNQLLQPDKQIRPKDGELLNMELRIYALIRLGINDSVKIAEFLHCSPQTVYNNRFKVRNKAIIDKKDFATTVQQLGKTARS